MSLLTLTPTNKESLFFPNKAISKLNFSGLADIIRKKNENYSNEDIIQAYNAGRIDFDFENRFNCSIKILFERERQTDLKICDYILKNFKNRILMITHNHPSSYILIELANQVLEKLGYSTLKKMKVKLNDVNLPYSPYIFDTYAYKNYGYTFSNDDPNVFITDFDEIISSFQPADDLLREYIQNFFN